MSLKFPLNLMGVQASFTLHWLLTRHVGLPCEYAKLLLSRAREGLLNQFRLVAWTFLGKDPVSIEFMSCDKFSCAGVYSSHYICDVYDLDFGAAASLIAVHTGCRLPRPEAETHRCKRRTLEEMSWAEWKMVWVHIEAKGREILKVTSKEEVEIRWTEEESSNHFLCLPWQLRYDRESSDNFVWT